METTLVYVVTSYGKVMGVYADPQDAFSAQMVFIQKNRLCELVPSPIIPCSKPSKK